MHELLNLKECLLGLQIFFIIMRNPIFFFFFNRAYQHQIWRCIFLGSSNSVGRYSFKTAKRFASNLLNYFSIFPAKTRVAVASYNGNVTLHFDFNKYAKKDCVQRQIKNLKWVIYCFLIIDICMAYRYLATMSSVFCSAQ